jgi:hypothetical protein
MVSEQPRFRMLTTAALLCFKWADGGVPVGMERYILGALITTQLLAAAAYAKKGILGPAGAYVTASVLMAVGAFTA